MKESKRILALLLLLSISLVGTGQTKKEKKELKAQQEEEQFAGMKNHIESGTYEFNADWANSFQGKRVNLVTNPNYLRLDQDKARIYLPYFGVAHNSAPAYSNMGAMEFEGSVDNYKVKINDKKKQVVVTFRCRAEKEVIDFTLSVFPDGNARLNANSNVRTSVNYDGKMAIP